MATRFKSKFPQRTGGSAGKSRNDAKGAKGAKGAKDNDYPNIIEEPIRIVGDQTRGKSKVGKSRKQSAKRSGQRSSKTLAKKSGKKKGF